MGDDNVYDALSANQGHVLYEMLNKSCDKHEKNKPNSYKTTQKGPRSL